MTQIEDQDDEPDVVAIDRSGCKALLTCTCLVPVTHWLDRMGENCLPDEAVVCVCGNDDHGWFVVDLEAFEYVTVH